MSTGMEGFNSKRTATIAMLIAVEVVILGFCAYILTGAHASWLRAGGFHRAAFSAQPITPLALGNSPVVTIDDPNSNISVSASSDGLVHVVDRSHVGGMVWSNNSNIPQLRVTRTANGVAITRAGFGSDFGLFNFGSMAQAIDVEVPAAAHVSILHCSGARVTDLHGDVAVRSDDGSITVERLHSNSVDLASGDGRITLADIATNALTAKSSDGHISATRVAFEGSAPSATIHSGDGSIALDGSFASAGSYRISSDDGSVRLALTSPSNVAIDASTDDGSIAFNGVSQANSDESDSTHQTLRIGDASGNLRVSSGDGSIHITTNGAN